jgi:hypothetical protein
VSDLKYCPYCGAQTRREVFVEDGAKVDITRCSECVWDEFTDDLEDIPDNPDFEGHVGFWMDVPGAAPIHVLGDPNMSEETANALRKLAEAAQKYVEDKGTPAPPEGYIALSDAEIKDAEEEDRMFQTCIQCGELTGDCQCDD